MLHNVIILFINYLPDINEVNKRLVATRLNHNINIDRTIYSLIKYTLYHDFHKRVRKDVWCDVQTIQRHLCYLLTSTTRNIVTKIQGIKRRIFTSKSLQAFLASPARESFKRHISTMKYHAPTQTTTSKRVTDGRTWWNCKNFHSLLHLY